MVDSSALSKAKDGFGSLATLVKRARADYDAEGRFSKLRIQIVVGFVLNLLLAGVVAIAARDTEVKLDAWWLIGFPSNLIVVDNKTTERFENVTMVLDGRYSHTGAVLKPGGNSFEIEKDFLDAKKFAPLRDQPPKQLEIQAGLATIRISLQRRDR
ncbi:MAG: hypothetical protein HYV07_34285 [Deltaproteobacteria bacterium]|nr:hypothetical protein [Deltaproteobacteria bacterium]